MIELIKGDITTLDVDAIVNAANTSLLGGGGVDGAIHRKAGPELLEECRKLNGCEVGQAKITSGYKLPAHFVIHTAGPVWRGGNYHEKQLLALCYRSSLKLANDFKLESVAFPNISTGVYHFPKESAAQTAINEVKNFLKSNSYPKKVIFVCFDDENYDLYKARL
jgi:O-acetyl-ADP-ribose deacetylase (regulator of RNase III)